jgi:hypothetical protein
MHNRLHGPKRIDDSDAATRQLPFDRSDIGPGAVDTATGPHVVKRADAQDNNPCSIRDRA